MPSRGPKSVRLNCTFQISLLRAETCIMRYGKLEAVYQRVECRLWPAFSHPTETQHPAFRWFSEILKLRRNWNCSPI